MPKKIDLTGRRFGNLTVLRPAENIGRKTAWVCRCDCGRETVVKTQCLLQGQTKSCGERPKSANNPLGLTYVGGTFVEQIATKKVRKTTPAA